MTFPFSKHDQPLQSTIHEPPHHASTLLHAKLPKRDALPFPSSTEPSLHHAHASTVQHVCALQQSMSLLYKENITSPYPRCSTPHLSKHMHKQSHAICFTTT
ncbi:hypothetical protein PIB30_098176 [Stylosanthes scabra]|uniref:Uncharacterized protein n=1 Tax=Stylosanthes scabra TaxID=79078 RepID=A0ABU6TYV3_9FABA|nr:hypothetical protein [Stylosanthes scabra]